MTTDFQAFPKIPRLYKDICVTEKIDGTNAQILITRFDPALSVPHAVESVETAEAAYLVSAGSRNRWLQIGDDNFGFASWVREHAVELVEILGEGRHYGEWWGSGIQRGYGLPNGERRLSLFNTSVWDWLADPQARAARHVPSGLHVVPTLYYGPFSMVTLDNEMQKLKDMGSAATPFMDPEGMMVYHLAANQYFKITFDTEHKGNARS